MRLPILTLFRITSNIAFLQVFFASVLHCVAVRVVLALHHLLIWKLLLILFLLALQVCVPSNCAHFRILVYVGKVSGLISSNHTIYLVCIHTLYLSRFGALVWIFLPKIQIAIDILLTRLAFILIKLMLKIQI